ncbi:glycosyltransferase family 4 protein [uncultured Tenacibaculum sp.]|uniref:glycosyltransferase family 4 protein n=1 Tax=uncultured Tenacibaculum sp. TaxID=174713 RepID=UPI002637A49B|nr:glycosyltransferase family 4 protein [uncultured Tenacibaculum sp.]
MNVLFVVGGGNLNAQIAQIALFLGLHDQENIQIHLIGRLSDDVVSFIESHNSSATYQKLYPKNKLDRDYITEFDKIIIDKKIDLVHFVCGKTSRTGLVALKKFPKIKTVIYYGSASLHWHDPSAYLTYLHPRIDAIIGNSNFVYNHVKKQLFGKRKQKAVRIFKGYSTDWFNNVVPFDYTTLGIPKDAIVVCSIGNHRKVKGTKYFLESSNHLSSDKDIHYVLIGDNTDAPHLSKIKENSKIKEYIHVLGRRDDVPSLLAGADMYVQSSLSEGFGRAISEAMSIGKPIIMTDAGGCTELIDENSGIVVPLRDYKAIGAAISDLANNDEKRIQMGKNAKNRIETVYSIERTVNDTLALYKKLLNE